MALFRTDFSGRGELSERQQKVFLLGIDSRIAQSTDHSTARPGTKYHELQLYSADRLADAFQVI